MLDSHQGLQNEFVNKNKRLESENKQMAQQLAVCKREYELEHMQLTSKVEELSKHELMMKNELKELKQEFDRKT
jgi:hypothetical protein